MNEHKRGKAHCSSVGIGVWVALVIGALALTQTIAGGGSSYSPVVINEDFNDTM